MNLMILKIAVEAVEVVARDPDVVLAAAVGVDHLDDRPDREGVTRLDARATEPQVAEVGEIEASIRPEDHHVAGVFHQPDDVAGRGVDVPAVDDRGSQAEGVRAEKVEEAGSGPPAPVEGGHRVGERGRIGPRPAPGSGRPRGPRRRAPPPVPG